MKFEISVDLDWVEEGETIDSQVRSEIVSSISRQLIEKSSKHLDGMLADVVAKAQGQVDDLMTNYLKDFTARAVVITDSWGTVKKRATIEELIKERIDMAFKSNVDSEGRLTDRSTGMTIVEYHTKRYAQKQIDAAFVSIRKDIDKSIDENLRRAAKEQLSDALLKQIDLDGLISSLQLPKEAKP